MCTVAACPYLELIRVHLNIASVVLTGLKTMKWQELFSHLHNRLTSPDWCREVALAALSGAVVGGILICLGKPVSMWPKEPGSHTDR